MLGRLPDEVRERGPAGICATLPVGLTQARDDVRDLIYMHEYSHIYIYCEVGEDPGNSYKPCGAEGDVYGLYAVVHEDERRGAGVGGAVLPGVPLLEAAVAVPLDVQALAPFGRIHPAAKGHHTLQPAWV